MEDLILKYGWPEQIVADRGSCFTSSRYQKFCLTMEYIWTLYLRDNFKQIKLWNK